MIIATQHNYDGTKTRIVAHCAMQREIEGWPVIIVEGQNPVGRRTLDLRDGVVHVERINRQGTAAVWLEVYEA